MPTSPRRTNRENLPLLRGRGAQRLQDYEDIDLDNENIFEGMFFLLHKLTEKTCVLQKRLFTKKGFFKNMDICLSYCKINLLL